MSAGVPPSRSCGVYRAPVDVQALRASSTAAGSTWFSLELGAVRDKSALLAECARSLALPPSFGANWDALSDCLRDGSWRPAAGCVLHFRDAAAFVRAAPDDYGILVEILREAARYWGARQTPWVALVDDAPSLPEYPA